ncbi:amidohydrolase family protein [Actinoplanes sp. N902-109]|uniref:amidohydrolase family protein n=1 Tax=Actinoplanes sp. (strain N902-109) TaxID=649831 RepID=UPI0003293468|nr:amidohydrolase family protein [Actinoplanes sp. N902-109]AGL17109.1 amidohydrolase [Actinoplanes sp. N902-109]
MARRRLTGDLFDIAQPSWAPDSRSIVVQSYRTGSFDLWLINVDQQRMLRLTEGPYDHREPQFSPDGSRIAFSSDRGGSYGIHVLDPASGAITTIADSAAEEYEPSWSPDGTRIAFVVANTRIDVVTVATGSRTTVLTVPAGQVLHAPVWTPDGTDLVHVNTHDGRSELWRGTTPIVTGEDVFPFRISWRPTGPAASRARGRDTAHAPADTARATRNNAPAAGDRTEPGAGRDTGPDAEFLYTADGRIKSSRGQQIGFVAPLSLAAAPRFHRKQRDFDSVRPRPVLGIGSPVLSPDGSRVAFRALNDIWTMAITIDRASQQVTGVQAPRPLTRDTWWKCDPAWSPDGCYLSYSTDRGGKLDIWLRDLRTGQDRRLTNLPGAAAVSGSWSPDSTMLAFLDQTGALHTVEVATGVVTRVFTATFEPGRPTWSADGETIALAAIKPYSARYREGLSKILLVDRRTGAGRYVDPLPGRSIQTRGDDGPVWSPDGTRMAFVVASVLYVADVTADGSVVGTPRQVTTEVTDAPSWSGDSRRLLYLHNGTLRCIPATGGRPVTVPVSLTWANTKPRGRTVIQAGRMWDGVSPRLASTVDIIVEGHRITAVEPHRAGRDGRIVDARDAVVIPGLIDMHHHREMQGYGYGARQGPLWLSLGITTTRSPGSPAYHMAEEREAIQSGARLGPRYFATGEAIDGSRIYYNFMRPTFSDEQLALELSRAGALDYDVMKAYVRLSPQRQRRVIAWAHEHGIPSTSHYFYPALAFGGDGMEHVGATSRFGFSRTVTALGNVHSDVAQSFIVTRSTLTPTLFNAVVLFRDDDSLVVDERVRTLYPAWEYATLLGYLQAARTTDQSAMRENLARQVAHVARVLRGGGRIITGTDAPIVPNAISTHYNLRAMVAYGMTPYEALITATSIPGEVLAEPLGRIEAGCYADLAILGGDPLTDIARAADVRQVMANGVLHTVPSLLAPFTAPTTASAAAATVEVLPPHPANAGFWWHDPHYLEEARHACCSLT